MAEIKRVFLIVLDSFGMGAMPDASQYGDEGSNTLKSVAASALFNAPVLTELGLLNIEGIDASLKTRAVAYPKAAYARLGELSKGKDTTIGHWEIAGAIAKDPLPTYPNGFPAHIMREFEKQTGRKAICNKPYSGTQVLMDFGREQIESGALIVYTSADSVFQIAAHEEYIELDELYRYCQIARDILVGKDGVGRVIARPFVGEYPNFRRTKNRRDFSLSPPSATMLDKLQNHNFETIGVGKISDIFAGKGIGKAIKTAGNQDGMIKTIDLLDTEFTGLCFTNLVDFDMLYGHRNDIDGYAKAISEFDQYLKALIKKMSDTDVVILTADHGCDPGAEGTDHTREYVPMLILGQRVRGGADLGTRNSFSDIAATILEMFEIEYMENSFWKCVSK